MPLFQVGPGANVVGCQLDPTRLGTAPHCRPLISLGGLGLFRTRGSATVLRRLQDARIEAQRNGIVVEGTLVAGQDLIEIRSVKFGVPPPVTTRIAKAKPVAKGKQAGRVQAFEGA